jgi:hypothetical protein
MDGGLTNIYIESVLSERCINFKGVFSCDNIPQHFAKLDQFSIICNFAKENETGSHFVSIIAFKEYVLYIDSFGIPCFNPSLQLFLSKTLRPIMFNTIQIQDFTSNFCGFYCILFVLHFNAQVRTKMTFSNNLPENDAICLKYIKTLLLVL